MTRYYTRNLAAVWLAQATTMLGFSFVFPFIPLYVQSLGVSDTTEVAQWAGLIGAAAALASAVMQPVWGSLADRWGRKPMLLRSMFATAIITTSMALVTSPEQLVILRFFQGGLSGTVAASNTLVAASTPRERLGYALGLMQVAVLTGSTLGPLFGGMAADAFGFRPAFYMAGVMMALAGVLVLAAVREDFQPPVVAARRVSPWGDSLSLLKEAVFSLLVAVFFLMQFAGTAVLPVLTLFIVELSGGGNAASSAGVVVGIGGAVSAAAALAASRISDRLGPRVVLTVCLAGTAAASLPLGLAGSMEWFLAPYVMQAAFLGGLLPTANVLLATSTPASRRGAAFGLSATAGALAGLVGPLVGAGVATWLGMRAVFPFVAVIFAVAAVWVTAGFIRLGRAEREESGEF